MAKRWPNGAENSRLGEFFLYRVAPSDGPVWITFALTGLGNAWIDDVTIQTISPRTAAPARMPVLIQPTGQR